MRFRKFNPHSEANASLLFLKEHGFAVYAAAGSAETEQALGYLWQYLEQLGTGIDRRDPSTWGSDRWPAVAGAEILVFFGIGQTEFMWYVRSLPGVQEAFAQLWGTHELLVSFDGVVVFRDVEGAIEASDGYWWHVDQNPRGLPGFDGVQGIVNLVTTRPEVGGLVLAPGSQHLYPDFYEERYGRVLNFMNEETHFFAIPSWDPEAHRSFGSVGVMPHLDAGDLIVWNSTTLHCSYAGSAFRTTSGSPAIRRVAALVAMTPKMKATQDVLERRKRAVCEGVTTTHWPHRFSDARDHNEALWWSLNRSKFMLPPPPVLNGRQLRMVGFADSELGPMSDDLLFHCPSESSG